MAPDRYLSGPPTFAHSRSHSTDAADRSLVLHREICRRLDPASLSLSARHVLLCLMPRKDPYSECSARSTPGLSSYSSRHFSIAMAQDTLSPTLLPRY